MHDLDHHLAGRDAPQHLLADRALADRADEILDHRERYAGLEQGDANVAQRRLDVGLAQRAAALQPIEDVAKTAGQALEHGLLRRNGPQARIGWMTGEGGRRGGETRCLVSRSQAGAACCRRFRGCAVARWPLFRAMDELAFHKMHGLGNDFVILDRRSGKLSLSAVQIRRIADRRLGGCDQLLSLWTPERADVFMRVYNPDGSESGACGNGTRCVARLVMEERAAGARRSRPRPAC